MAFGHLVEDLHLLAALGRILQGQLHTSHRIADVDEGAGLAAGAMDGEGIADRRLHQEAVQHRAVIAVVVEAIGEARILLSQGGVGAPNDALVQVGDADGVVFVVVEEEQLVERLGHVIDAAGIRGVQDLFGEAAAIGLGHFHREIALGNRGATVGAVAVDPHGAQVDDVGIEAALHNGCQQVVGAVDVVINGVALGGARFHRIGGSPLFGEMDDCFGSL